MTSYWRIALPWLLIVAVAALATWIRYAFIEPSQIGQICEAVSTPWWCSVRQTLIMGFITNTYGYAAIAAAVLALVWRQTFAATMAAALGLFALQLYCYEAGALAMLIGLLRLVRLQLTPANPGDQHRDRNQQVQAGP
jgi:hypothetical protein